LHVGFTGILLQFQWHELTTTFHALGRCGLAKNGENGNCSGITKPFCSYIGNNIFTRRRTFSAAIRLSGFFAVNELEVITDLAKPEDLLQDSNVILHHLIFPREVRKFILRLLEEPIVNLLFLGIKLQVTQLFVAWWKGKDFVSISSLCLFCPAKCYALHNGLKANNTKRLAILDWIADIFCPDILVVKWMETQKLDESKNIVQFVLHRGTCQT
jgi:hypothetical protein